MLTGPIHYWLPPTGEISPCLDKRHFIAAMKLVLAIYGVGAILHVATMDMTYHRAFGTLLAVLGGVAPIAIALWTKGYLLLTREAYWLLIKASMFSGFGSAVIGAAAVVIAGPDPSAAAQSFAAGAIEAVILSPVVAVISLGLTQREHHLEYPLTGEEGDLEA